MRSSPPTFRLPPHWGHDVGDRLSNPPDGLIGSKTDFSVPIGCYYFVQKEIYAPAQNRSIREANEMDFGILIGIALIVIWALGALAFEGPGWIHLLLTVGVFVVIWRIVVRGDRRHPDPK